MVYEHLPSAKMHLWAAKVRGCGLAGVVIPILDVLQAWGFVGGQLLWMVAPFFGQERIAPYAEALEQPEVFYMLKQYLNEGEA